VKNKPIFRSVERAKSVIKDDEELFLKTCAKCDADFYGDVKETRCENCRKRKK
jgi:hypothetical protein